LYITVIQCLLNYNPLFPFALWITFEKSIRYKSFRGIRALIFLDLSLNYHFYERCYIFLRKRSNASINDFTHWIQSNIILVTIMVCVNTYICNRIALRIFWDTDTAQTLRRLRINDHINFVVSSLWTERNCHLQSASLWLERNTIIQFTPVLPFYLTIFPFTLSLLPFLISEPKKYVNTD